MNKEAEQALQVFHKLIEQANGQGFFKQLSQLDIARHAHKKLQSLLTQIYTDDKKESNTSSPPDSK